MGKRACRFNPPGEKGRRVAAAGPITLDGHRLPRLHREVDSTPTPIILEQISRGARRAGPSHGAT